VPGPTTFAIFAFASFVLIIVPGPAVIYIVTRSVDQGRAAGLVSMLGIEAGALVHVTAATLGVSAIVASSATAFGVLKWAGAAYLVLLGMRRILRPEKEVAERESASHQRIFAQGIVVSALNPKVAIFFLAFVPQFIAPEAAHKALAFVLLGTLFNINSVAINSGWALAAAWMARKGLVQRGMHWLDRAAGAMFMGFGLKLALTDNPTA
jgi:threonine/homoserine/homoserine lactone efflux protein